MIFRYLLLFLAGSVGGLLSGCATSHRTEPAEAEKEERWFDRNALLFLRSAPFPKLFVEVDAVKGSEPDDKALRDLHSFLGTHCDKPGGIVVERSDVISVESARGYSATALAKRFVDGPPKTAEPAQAFLYVLFYNDALSVKSRQKHNGKGAGLLLIPNREVVHPYAMQWPYPTICFNMGFTMGVGTGGILQHEAGHILGLASRSRNARGAHCRTWGCGMQSSFDYLRTFGWLLGPPSGELCTDCQAELRQRLTKEAPNNLRYVGPVLVRSEQEYHVLHLPNRVAIFAGKLTQEDCDSFLSSARAGTLDDKFWLSCTVKNEALASPEKLAAAVTQLKSDADVPLRQTAPGLLVGVCARQYAVLRQFTNTVRMLERITQIDPKDAGAYNQLAWLQATCPDETVRDGPAAIAAAITSCELTGWKNRHFVDCLAAAYAESSAFHKAVEYQERALQTGHPTKVERDQMQARLNLYRQSQPYRTK